MTARSLLLAALTFAALALAACGGDDTGSATDAAPIDQGTGVDAAPRQVILETVSLVPGELAEGIMTGGPSDYAVIHLEAPVAELDWNIHGHAGGATQTVFEQLNQRTVDYVFEPTATADWYLLLRNSGPAAMDVTVRVELYGDLQWRWQ
jgi:hypothetical protein